MPLQVVFNEALDLDQGLRERKKTRTRLAIEEIAALADVSTTTFFRYFPSKAEVLVADHGQQLPALHRAIVERPWVAAVDPEGRHARHASLRRLTC